MEMFLAKQTPQAWRNLHPVLLQPDASLKAKQMFLPSGVVLAHPPVLVPFPGLPFPEPLARACLPEPLLPTFGCLAFSLRYSSG